MEIKVLNKEGKATTKKIKLNKNVFAIEPNDHEIYLELKQYLSNQRQGTHQAR
jgi:large subunit ribosomal protein L4